jgi:hypothetical protein
MLSSLSALLPILLATSDIALATTAPRLNLSSSSIRLFGNTPASGLTGWDTAVSYSLLGPP